MSVEKKITVCSFRKKKKRGEKIVCLTAYDAPTAKLASESGVDLLLVGDSMGMAILGYRNTLSVTLEQSLHHAAAVRRGAENAFIVGDMPFMTYRISIPEALRNAARYLQEAGTDAVKVEGGIEAVPTIKHMVESGIPVMAHIGLLPQKVLVSGGYRIVGKTEKELERLMEDAKAVQDAGAFAVVLEGIPAESAKKITESLIIPTIGIGAGPHCDGQVQVVNDILGLFTDFVPRHAKRYADLTSEMKKAFDAYVSEVREGKFPAPENSF